jgi:RNA polymerase sigma factor (sigma-70 family)
MWACLSKVDRGACGNLLRIPTDDEMRSLCDCGQECRPRDELVERHLGAGRRTARDREQFVKAQKLHQELRKLCADCEKCVDKPIWCPWCADHRDSLEGNPKLSQRLTNVYVRVRRNDAVSTFEAMRPAGPGPTHAPEVGDEFARAKQALDELPSNLREAWRLVKFEGRSAEEAAEELGVTARTVRAWVAEAIERLGKRGMGHD